MLKNSTVTYLSEHLLPMSPVYTLLLGEDVMGTISALLLSGN
jgi:hypothetical protein